MTALPYPHSRWEKDTRYYELRVQQDLFGDWLLIRAWGRRDSALGQIRQELCDSYEQARVQFTEAEVRRVKRGYRFTSRPIR
jgi:predicted DNA-binding WGR domain protein